MRVGVAGGRARGRHRFALKMIDDGCRHRVREDPGRQAGRCITNSYNAASTGNRYCGDVGFWSVNKNMVFVEL